MQTIPILFLLFIAFVAISFVVEGLRKRPVAPTSFWWSPEVEIQQIGEGAATIRYIDIGSGTPLVLLHSIRTQLDLFFNIYPLLRKNFRVIAIDLPGHGFSGIPSAKYDADFFSNSVEHVVEMLKLENATIAGVSIGGSIALQMGANKNPRISSLVAINPYNYYGGKGMARSSFLGRVLTAVVGIPVIGASVMRMRFYGIMLSVFKGSSNNLSAIPNQLLREMYLVGNRKNHYLAFLKMLNNSESWENSLDDFKEIEKRTLIIWSKDDWSTTIERDRLASQIPHAQIETVEGGHLATFDSPECVVRLINEFAM